MPFKLSLQSRERLHPESTVIYLNWILDDRSCKLIFRASEDLGEGSLHTHHPHAIHLEIKVERMAVKVCVGTLLLPPNLGCFDRYSD